MGHNPGKVGIVMGMGINLLADIVQSVKEVGASVRFVKAEASGRVKMLMFLEGLNNQELRRELASKCKTIGGSQAIRSAWGVGDMMDGGLILDVDGDIA